jgi:predicted acylesterase/phospholipase RssA
MTQPSVQKANPSTAKPRIALALAGGGPLGAIYEIGALCALDESLQGLSFTGCTTMSASRPAALSRRAWPTA